MVVRTMGKSGPNYRQMLLVNVLVLAVVVALLSVLVVFLTTKPAFAGREHLWGYDSVDCEERTTCQIRYVSSSQYGDAVSHADAAWSPVGRVIIAPNNGAFTTDVGISDRYGACDVDWVGQTTIYGLSADTMEFNVCNFNQSDYGPFKRAGTATHEFGHTLGLYHMPIPNIMHSPSSETGRNTPYTHDKADYQILW